MLIFDDNSNTVLLDNIYVPVAADYMWVLDLNMMDFTLAPLLILEETISPTIVVEILGFQFPLPSNWNMLVVDEETSQLDIAEIQELSGKEFRALVYGPNLPKVEMVPVRVVNYYPNYSNVGPSLNKHQMLCHPISPDRWVNISPSDGYNKYLKNHVVGDIF